MPENITEPSAMLPARSRIRITAYDVTDLPEPDSPTMPSVSPLATEMLTCCTALTMPRRVENSTVRSLTSRRDWAVTMASPTKRSKTTPCTVGRDWNHWGILAGNLRVRRARTSRSLPPCGGGLGRGVAPGEVGVRGYPSP